MLSLKKPNALHVNYSALNSTGNSYNYMHTQVRMLTVCVTAIIYYIIIYSVYAFIKSTNMIYHNCGYQGDVYYFNQICLGHILLQKPLKSLLLYLKFAIVTNMASNNYSNINRFLLNNIIYFPR